LAEEAELIARSETISIAKSFEKTNKNIRTVVWDSNTGITNHAIRILTLVFNEFDYAISLEEDNFLHDGIFEFFQTCLLNKSSNGFVATAYNSRPHPVQNDGTFITTLFPEQWVVMMSKEIFLTFLEVFTSQTISKRVLRKHFSSALDISKLRVELLSEYWFNHLKLCLRSPSHGDALITYSSYVNSVPYFAPVSNFVTDLGGNNPGGMNLRNASPANQIHELSVVSRGGFNYCAECEFIKSRVSSYSWREALGNRKYFAQLRLNNTSLRN
jgi:hypothetical protein